jgi:phosphatidylserine/phosphatidylglycerophosphate/cardiolipin synthase-like enzyme
MDRKLVDKMRDSGVQVCFFRPPPSRTPSSASQHRTHRKLLIVDGTTGFTLCVQSERFAGKLHDAFERDLRSSERIDPEAWAGRPAAQRAREHVTKYARREL